MYALIKILANKQHGASHADIRRARIQGSKGRGKGQRGGEGVCCLSSKQKRHYCIGNRLFYFQTNTEKKQNIKNLAVKKWFPQFLLSMYVCLCVCVFVCLSVIALQTSSFSIGVWNFNIDIYIKYLKMVSFTFLNFCLFLELFPFFIIYQFLYFKAASQHIMKTNTSN